MLERWCLRWVNKERVKADLPELTHLTKGIKKEPTACVFANAFSDGGDVHIQDMFRSTFLGSDRRRLPLRAVLLIAFFDHGRMPELEIRTNADLYEEPSDLYKPRKMVSRAKDDLSLIEKYKMRQAVKQAEREIADEQIAEAMQARLALLERQRQQRAEFTQAVEMLAYFVADMGSDYEAPQTTVEVVIPDQPMFVCNTPGCNMPRHTQAEHACHGPNAPMHPSMFEPGEMVP